MIEPTYDNRGRMNYHPEFHENHGKPFSQEELEYLCKYWESDDKDLIALALGRTEKTLHKKVRQLRQLGLYDYYKNRNKYW